MEAQKAKIKFLICEKVDSMADEIVQTVQRFIQIPSVIGQEGVAQEWIAQLYHSLGLDVKTVVPKKDELSQHPAYLDTGLPYDESRPNIVGIFHGQNNWRSLILNGHVDVVSPEPVETWERGGPWSGTIEGNLLFGRGSADMKSGLIANYFALKTLLDLKLKPKGKIILESVIEEEAGGSGGTLALFLAGYRANAMVIPEPFSLNIITAHSGVQYFRINVIGKTAHAAESQKGVNAIGKLAKIYDRLVELDLERARKLHDVFFEKLTGRSCNLSVGTFNAGDWPTTVAGWAELRGRISYLPSEAEQDIKEEIERALKDVAANDDWLKEHPPQVEWYLGIQPWMTDQKTELVQEFCKTTYEILSQAPEVAASTMAFDARFGPLFGVPALIFGPKGGALHGSNEYVEIDSVIKNIKVLAAFIVNWCGVK